MSVSVRLSECLRTCLSQGPCVCPCLGVCVCLCLSKGDVIVCRMSVQYTSAFSSKHRHLCCGWTDMFFFTVRIYCPVLCPVFCPVLSMWLWYVVVFVTGPSFVSVCASGVRLEIYFIHDIRKGVEPQKGCS